VFAVLNVVGWGVLPTADDVAKICLKTVERNAPHAVAIAGMHNIVVIINRIRKITCSGSGSRTITTSRAWSWDWLLRWFAFTNGL
jgi:hypothetical protein